VVITVCGITAAALRALRPGVLPTRRRHQVTQIQIVSLIGVILDIFIYQIRLFKENLFGESVGRDTSLTHRLGSSRSPFWLFAKFIQKIKMMEAGYHHQGQQEMESGQEEYQMQSSFKKVEEMENYGVNKTDIIKLKAGGYNTIESVR
jgi:hypothetical protein